jgi:Tol biopolymer transport system component
VNRLGSTFAAVLAAGVPVASAPGLAVSQGGKLYVEGALVGAGTQPAWSADGSRLAFVRGGGLYVAGAHGENPRRVASQASSPAWSPDGRRLVYTSRNDLFTVAAATGRSTRLTRSTEPWRLNVTPAYSPDGKLIAFARSTDPFNSDIFVMRTNGTHLRRLTTTQATDSTFGEEHGPTWSPDGRTIVFVSNRSQTSWELYSIRLDGTRERQITRTPSRHYNENEPRFSSDGRSILYTHDGRVAVIAVDGSGRRELGRGESADWR